MTVTHRRKHEAGGLGHHHHHKSTARDHELREKEKFREYLYEIAHRVLDRRRERHREKFYREVVEKCKPSTTYQNRIVFLDSSIEAAQEYFSNA